MSLGGDAMLAKTRSWVVYSRSPLAPDPLEWAVIYVEASKAEAERQMKRWDRNLLERLQRMGYLHEPAQLRHVPKGARFGRTFVGPLPESVEVAS